MTLYEKIKELNLTARDTILTVGEGELISAPIEYFLRIKSELNRKVVKQLKDEDGYVFYII